MSARKNYLHLKNTGVFGVAAKIKEFTKKQEKKRYGNKNKR